MDDNLTERQKAWFASVRAGLVRDTGKSLEAWAETLRARPETTPKARTAWLKAEHGLGANRAAMIIGAAFPESKSWDDPQSLRAALWADDASTTTLLYLLETVITRMPDVIPTQRTGYSAWSRKVQFAAAKPVRGGKLALGLAITPETDARLILSKNESWSERLTAKLILSTPSDIDASIAELLHLAWIRS